MVRITKNGLEERERDTRFCFLITLLSASVRQTRSTFFNHLLFLFSSLVVSPTQLMTWFMSVGFSDDPFLASLPSGCPSWFLPGAPSGSSVITCACPSYRSSHYHRVQEQRSHHRPTSVTQMRGLCGASTWLWMVPGWHQVCTKSIMLPVPHLVVLEAPETQ